MLYLLCWNGEEYKLTSEIEGELVQMLCCKEEADRVLKRYVEEGYGKDRGYSKALNSYLDSMRPTDG